MKSAGERDPRPTAWVGHIELRVPDPQASKAFFVAIGLRDVEPGAAPLGILELRGGTHLLLLPTEEPVPAGAPAPFDLMVSDLAAFRQELLEMGHQPTEVAERPFHTSFTVREPGGHELTINSSHNTGLPV